MTEQNAEELLGRKLSPQEKIMISVFGSDDRYFWSKDENGNLTAKILKETEK